MKSNCVNMKNRREIGHPEHVAHLIPSYALLICAGAFFTSVAVNAKIHCENGHDEQCISELLARWCFIRQKDTEMTSS